MDHPPARRPPGPGRDDGAVTMPNRRDAPMRYEVRVEGHLDRRWSSWFDGLALTHEPDGTTTLRGHVTDQARLHGLLDKVRDLGATLLSVTTLDRR